MAELSQKQRILRRLMDAMLNRETIIWPPGSGQLLRDRDGRPVIGELPLPILRSAECGGDSAQVRLNELRMPEEEAKQYSGIPIHKAARWYSFNNVENKVITYRLGITKPDYIEQFIDFHNCRLNKQAVADAGGKIIEFLDDADGHDKAGRAVKIVKADHQQDRNQKPLFKGHPLAQVRPLS